MVSRLQLGRRAFDPTRRRLMLGPRIDWSKLPYPTSADWLRQVRSWPMDGNDQYGDCVWAEIAHEIEARTSLTGAPVEPTTEDCLTAYHVVTGFDRNKPSTDQGTNMADAMNYWRKVGLAGHKILAFAGLDLSVRELEAGVALFGAVALGIRFPASAMDQFNAGQPWDVVADDGGIEGGHAIHLGEYDDATGTFEVITWGAVQRVTWAFLERYLDEAWVVITQDWLNAAGTSPSGLDLHGLGADLALLTGEPNPFPAPSPAAADAALAAAFRASGWIDRHHVGANAHVAAEARAWLAARGI